MITQVSRLIFNLKQCKPSLRFINENSAPMVYLKTWREWEIKMYPLRIKRAYDPPTEEDGARYLVDRLWPRGKRKEALQLTGWIKEVAPSAALRRWFGHDPDRWEAFQKKYFEELEHNPESWRPLLNALEKGAVTLVYAAKDTDRNNAVALKAFLESRLSDKTPPETEPGP